MLIKITTRDVVFDIENPERKFKQYQVLKVNDPKRAKKMLSNGIGVEVEEATEFEELDKEEKPKKKAKKPSKNKEV